MSSAELIEARKAYRRRDWSKCHRLFQLADRTLPLDVDDLERLVTSAYLIGRDMDFHVCLERAHHAHLQARDSPRAARCAFWLGLTLRIRGEGAQANGWLSRAQRLVEGRDCVEHGYLLLAAAEQRLGEREAKAAVAAASTAVEFGNRFGDADLTACALHLLGRAIIQLGDVDRGLALLDEAMIAVTAGELSPIVTGLIYCSVIDACLKVFAVSRAREWTSALKRWCELQPDIVAFRGTCLVHRAEILQLHGAWGDAMAAARQACERAAAAYEQESPAEAWYRQGDIRRLRGEFDAAEEDYRRASRAGLDPQPGLALLRMSQGRIDAARAAVCRALGVVTDPLHRARLLPACAEISLAAGDLDEARKVSAELNEIAEQYQTDVLQAMASYTRGSVALAAERPQDALRSLGHAFELWQQIEAKYEIARVRLLTALACRALGDDESARLEFDAARALLEPLQAAPDLARLNTLRKHSTQTAQHEMTGRELQVLRRIASGKTNKAIATELVLSERTIDRHVSNILAKLGVTSRTAAVTVAHDRKLI